MTVSDTCSGRHHPYLSSEKDIPLSVLASDMTLNLDEVDRKILRELQKDGRASFRDVSSRINVSTPTVSSRVQAMHDVGLIKGYSTVLDADMLGQVSVALTLESKPADIERVVERIKDEEIVRQIYVLSDSRVLCILAFFNQMKYQKFLESLAQISEIVRMDNSMVMRVPKESPRAALTDEAGLLIRCYYCGHMMKDEGVKIKLDGKYHYLCCSVCERLYREKYEKLKKSAGIVKTPIAEEIPVHAH
jgi:DNA-binding Lrp family transcriptional regulator